MLRDFEQMYIANITPWDTGVPSTELGLRLAAGEIPPSGSAVDLGCGTGTNMLYLAQWGFEVVGVDASPRAIQLAQEKANLNKMGRAVKFILGDVCRVRNIGEPFDFVFDRGCYHSAREENLAGYLDTLESFTKPGSLFLCLAGSTNEKNMKPDEGPPRVTEQQLRDELGVLFEVVDLREFQFDASAIMPGRPLGWSCLMKRR